MATARQTYNRLWRRAAPLYGVPGQAAPTLQVSAPGSMGSMRTDRNGPAPVVYAKPWMMRALAGKGRHGESLLDAEGYRRLAQKTLLHEWRHTVQPGAVWDDIPTSEADASQFAQQHARSLIVKPYRQALKQRARVENVKQSPRPQLLQSGTRKPRRAADLRSILGS